MPAINAPHLRRRLSLAALCVVALLSASPAAAAPSNAKIEAARQQARDARDQLDELAADLEERSEEYLVVEGELASTRQRIRVAEAELRDAEEEVRLAELQLNDRALSIYRGGSIDIWSVFTGLTSFQDLVTRLEFLQRVGRSDAALVARVSDARMRLERTRAGLENRRSEQVTLLKQAARKKQAVEAALAAQQAYLSRLDSRLKTLIAEERARQERLAREREAAAARAAAAKRVATRSGDTTDLPQPHPEALAVARRFIGKTPYVWGGTTPRGFDCSGLTQYSYRAIGINIPRTSRQQYRFGAFIPPDRLDLLAPGDLVFFARDADPDRVHHVGIYSGNGRFVHAPQTGMLVMESSLVGRIQEKGDYVGAVRP